MFWQGGAGSMVDGDGVTGSGRKGTTTAERLPAIKPSFGTKFLLLSGWGWKKPSRKEKIKQFFNDAQYFLQFSYKVYHIIFKALSLQHSSIQHLSPCWVGRLANKSSENSPCWSSCLFPNLIFTTVIRPEGRFYVYNLSYTLEMAEFQATGKKYFLLECY